MQNWLLHWVSNQKVFASSPLQTKLKKKNENERKQFQNKWPEPLSWHFCPSPNSSSNMNFQFKQKLQEKAFLHTDSPRRQTNDSAPKQEAWRNPHTRSLDQDQGHARASASTHWATCPLISSGLCLAFKLHRGCRLPLCGEETRVLTRSWNRGSHKECGFVLRKPRFSFWHFKTV